MYFCEIDVFVKKRVKYYLNLFLTKTSISYYVWYILEFNVIYEIMSDSRDRGKERKKSQRLKKGHQKSSALKWIFFLKKVIRKFVGRKCFSIPPNSAPGLRLWVVFPLPSAPRVQTIQVSIAI